MPVVTALAITLWGFYIEEGKYNFNGIFKPDNLFVLIVYAAFFFGFQLLVKLGFEHFTGTAKSGRMISSALAALSLPLAIAVFLSMVSGV